jgi:CRISPR-associated protein Csb2
MSKILSITFRFIQPSPTFHGRVDADEPEWPPSPMRAFQALLNAACSRSRGKPLPSDVHSALQVLELFPPHIIAPRAKLSTVGYRAYVPHNQTDLVTAAWHRGSTEANIAGFRTEKDIRPMRVESSGDDLPAVRYLYSLDAAHADPRELLAAIRPAARSIHCLGWGIDQVIADAVLIDESDLTSASGEHWRPGPFGGRPLRVPRSGSLDALCVRHRKFLNRLDDNNWTPVPPLQATTMIRYHRDTDPLPRPCAVFKLVDENEDAYRYAHAKLVHIAGMVRHSAIEAMARNPPPFATDPGWISRVVRGKRDESSTNPHRQFSYVPLPSIGHAHADAMIRNIMIVAPLGMGRELNYLTEQLNGQALEPEGDAESSKGDSTPCLPRRIELQKFTPPRGKFIAECYLGTSRVWHTVTPVILDGHNDKKAEKTIKLIQAALQRSGIETPCTFTWQSIPFLKNCLTAHKYDQDGRHTGYHRPAHLSDQTAIHVRLTFDHPVPGPLIIGSGRHCGFGLFSAVLENP